MATILEKQLDLLIELDRASDESEDETGFALEVVELLADALNAELAALAIPEEEGEAPWGFRGIKDHAELLAEISPNRLQKAVSQAESFAETAFFQGSWTHEEGQPAVHFIVSTLRINDEHLGSVVLARRERGFSIEEIDLLEVAGKRIDSALRQIQLNRALQRETRLLRTIRRIDHIRDTSGGLEELLNRTLSVLCEVIPAEIAFVMLYDRQGKRLNMRAITDSEILKLKKPLQNLYNLADTAIEQGQIVRWSDPAGELRAFMGVPLILNERVIGVLGVLNPREQPRFKAENALMLEGIASQMDTAIFESLEIQRVRETFGRNVGEKVMERLLQVTDRDLLKGDRVEVTALFSDIRNFTGVSQNLDPEVLQRMINIHLDVMVEVILDMEGTLDKFLGDGILAFFNAPERQEDHVLRAVETALKMQSAHQEVMTRWESQGLPVCAIGIGVATGEAIVGNFGSEAYSEYTVIGREVNLASRLCSAAGSGQILINQRIYERLKEQIEVEELTAKTLKGFSTPVPIWQVNGLR